MNRFTKGSWKYCYACSNNFSKSVSFICLQIKKFLRQANGYLKILDEGHVIFINEVK